ncbi:MAG: hypothetical protein AB1817_00930 [Chloroflexota bacterium]
MTSQQKTILIILALVNGLCFCCGLPIALLILSGDSLGMTTAFAPEPSTTPTKPAPTPSSTLTPSPTPRATATRVIPLLVTPVLTPAEPGWTLYPLPQERFAISVPTSWVAQNFDPATLASLMQKVQEKNPQYAKTLGSQAPQMAATGIKFIAIDLTPQPDASNFATNLNVIHHAIPQAVTMDNYISTNVKQLEDSGVAKSINHRRIKLPAGDAEELRYIATMVISGSEKTQIAITQYLILHSREGYVLTLTTDPKLDAKYFPTFEKIAKSLQWTQ